MGIVQVLIAIVLSVGIISSVFYVMKSVVVQTNEISKLTSTGNLERDIKIILKSCDIEMLDTANNSIVFDPNSHTAGIYEVSIPQIRSKKGAPLLGIGTTTSNGYLVEKVSLTETSIPQNTVQINGADYQRHSVKFNFLARSKTNLEETFSFDPPLLTTILTNSNNEIVFCPDPPPPPPEPDVAGLLDFGGGYQKIAPVDMGPDNFKSRGDNCLKRNGETEWIVQKAWGTTNLDWQLSICYRPHVEGQPTRVDFGGMYGYGGKGPPQADTEYKNPITGTMGCPSGYSSHKFMGVVNIEDPSEYVDRKAMFCYRNHQEGRDQEYGFGGMIGYGAESSGKYNPITGTKDCPTGYTKSKIIGTSDLDHSLFFCWIAL
jgi:hypothetical protein